MAEKTEPYKKRLVAGPKDPIAYNLKGIDYLRALQRTTASGDELPVKVKGMKIEEGKAEDTKQRQI